MKFLFDLFPVILFFITLKVAEKTASANLVLTKILSAIGFSTTVKPDLVPIMLATIAVIIASIIQIIWVKVKHGKVDKTLWLSALLVTVLGGLTLYFQNDAFIKWKPTILYWVFAVALVASEIFAKKNFIKMMMGADIGLPEKVWKTLNTSWAIFFLCLGFINLYVAFHYSTDTWATFKLFGTMGLMFVFVIGQSLWLNQFLPTKDENSVKDKK